MTTQHKLGLLGALYFSQGLPFGFFTQALPVLMRKEGRSLEEVGLSGLLALPWAMKFLWAPLVDRYGHPGFGRRRSWIVPLQLLATLTLFALAFQEQGAIPVLAGAIVLTNLLAATQDIATDGWAVDLLNVEERGLANGLQVAGYRLGMIIGGGVLLMVIDRLGWRDVFFAMSGLLALATIPVLLTRETPTSPAPAQARPRYFDFFLSPSAGRVLVLVSVFKIGESFANGMIKPYLVDSGFGLSDVGFLSGTVGFGGGLLGALLGGYLAGRVPRQTALLYAGTGQIFAVASYAALAFGYPVGGGRPPIEPFALVMAIEHILVGMGTAALFTAMMDWSRPGTGAADYTVQACAVVVATGAASALSGYSAHALGFGAHFAVATGLAALGLVPVWWAWPRPS